MTGLEDNIIIGDLLLYDQVYSLDNHVLSF